MKILFLIVCITLCNCGVKTALRYDGKTVEEIFDNPSEHNAEDENNNNEQ